MLAIAVALVACVTRPPVEHFVGVLDGLRVPVGWTLAREAVRGPGSAFIACDFALSPDCPSVHRFYWWAGEPQIAYAAATLMLVDAGFTVTEELVPDCTGFHDDLIACEIYATKGSDNLIVSISEPGVDREELGIAEPGMRVIEVRAYPVHAANIT
jgi:hypothetical protein